MLMLSGLEKSKPSYIIPCVKKNHKYTYIQIHDNNLTTQINL